MLQGVKSAGKGPAVSYSTSSVITLLSVRHRDAKTLVVRRQRKRRRKAADNWWKEGKEGSE